MVIPGPYPRSRPVTVPSRPVPNATMLKASSRAWASRGGSAALVNADAGAAGKTRSHKRRSYRERLSIWTKILRALEEERKGAGHAPIASG